MKFTKEDWWEYIKSEDLIDIKDETVLYALEQAFYSGYACKETEIQIREQVLEHIVKEFT